MATNNPDDNNRVLEPHIHSTTNNSPYCDTCGQDMRAEPPSSLHTKLQTIQVSHILQNPVRKGDEVVLFLNDEAIAQILQAFQEAGWVDTGIDTDVQRIAGLKTGQDFYDRFKAELDKQPTISTDGGKGEALISLTNVYKALKVAAGVSE